MKNTEIGFFGILDLNSEFTEEFGSQLEIIEIRKYNNTTSTKTHLLFFKFGKYSDFSD